MIDEVKITLRYPRTLHAALTKLAAANRRSINAEVVMAIEGHVAANATRKTALSVAKTLSASKNQTAGWFEVIHPKRKPTKRAKGKR